MQNIEKLIEIRLVLMDRHAKMLRQILDQEDENEKAFLFAFWDDILELFSWIKLTTCAAFLNQFHPFLVRTFGMSLNHSCPTPLLCTMSILDKQHFTLNQTCPMS